MHEEHEHEDGGIRGMVILETKRHGAHGERERECDERTREGPYDHFISISAASNRGGGP